MNECDSSSELQSFCWEVIAWKETAIPGKAGKGTRAEVSASVVSMPINLSKLSLLKSLFGIKYKTRLQVMNDELITKTKHTKHCNIWWNSNVILIVL